MIALYLAQTHVPGTELAVCLSLLPALFAMFQLDIFLWRLRAADERPLATSMLSGVNCAGILTAIWTVVSPEQVDRVIGGAFFAVAAFQVVLGRALWVLSASEPNRHLSVSFYSQGSMAAALGFPVAFDRAAVVLGWSAQALTLVWFVRHVRSVLLRAKVPLLLAGGLVYIAWYFASPDMLEGSTVLGLHVVTRMWLAAGVALAGAVAAWLFARWYTQSTWRLERAMGEVSAALGTCGAVIAVATLVALEPQALQWVWVTVAAAACLGLLSYRARVLRLPGLMVPALAVVAVLIVHDLSSGQSSRLLPQDWQLGPITCGHLLPAGLALAMLSFWNAWLLRHAATTRDLPADPAEWICAAGTACVCLVLRDQLGDDNPAYAVIGAAAAALAIVLAACAGTGPPSPPGRRSPGAWRRSTGPWLRRSSSAGTRPVRSPRSGRTLRPCSTRPSPARLS